MAVYEFVELTGTILPNTVDIRTQVENEYKVLFDEDLSVNPSTPQGMLITAETADRDGVARNNAALANQINPNIAGGVFLDALWALTGGQRTPNNYSVLENVELTGVAATLLPQGSIIAKTSSDIFFTSLNTVTLNGGGTGTANFQCTLPGPINVDPDTLTIIVTSPLGLETINNPSAAIPGSYTQSDEAAKFYRKNTLALQGQSTSEAITSRVYAIPGVKSLSYRENKSSATVTIDGILMVPHSIYACIDGGPDDVIASTLQRAKEAGADYNGNVTVNYTDPNSGQVIPVQFDRPTVILCLVRITIAANSLSSVADPTGTVVAALLSYANGLIPNEPGLKVGYNVSPFELSGGLNYFAPSMFCKKVEVAYSSGGGFQTTELAIALSEKALITANTITVIYA